MSRRLRVLVLARSYPNALFPQLGLWTERPTRRIAESCDAHVVSPVPWCPPLPALPVLEQYRRFRGVPLRDTQNGVAVEHPRFVVGPATTGYALEAAAYYAGIRRRVDRLHRQSPFDLIHAHFIYPDGVVAARLARRWGVPFVVTEHAPWTGWLDRLGVARQALPAARSAATIMPVSTSVAGTIRAYAGDRLPIEVVPVGVDGTEFTLGPADHARNPDQILFAGFLNYVKGVDVLLQAMVRLVESGSSARLLLAGGAFYRNTQLQESRLRALAASLPLGDRVQFLGRRPIHEVARLMRESSVVVLPSRAESFGAVLVEALASGTPVVATRCGGPEDIVRPEVGELVPVDDPPALADALRRVLAWHDVDRLSLREYALGRFDWSVIVDRTLEIYRRVAG